MFFMDAPPQVYIAGVCLVVAFFGIHLFTSSCPRVGDTEYCKKCKTDVSQVYDHCPNCKQSKQSYGVLLGDRELNVTRFVIGVILAAAAVGLILYVFLSFDHDAA